MVGCQLIPALYDGGHKGGWGCRLEPGFNEYWSLRVARCGVFDSLYLQVTGLFPTFFALHHIHMVKKRLKN
jgi:hypothetical protein